MTLSRRLPHLLMASLLLISATAAAQRTQAAPKTKPKPAAAAPAAPRVIHVFIALCDNDSQGIMPVPPAIGDGDKPEANLYWGCDEGLYSHFKRSKSWELKRLIKDPGEPVLRRAVFRHRATGALLVADAYRGSAIRRCTEDLAAALAGRLKLNVRVEPDPKTPDADVIEFEAGGAADLVAYIGHDGLMDFTIEKFPKPADTRIRDAVILACSSRHFFTPLIAAGNAFPLLWTTNLMYPGSFILHDALEGWLKDETPEQIRERAAKAYAANQKCSLKAARGLLVTGTGE